MSMKNMKSTKQAFNGLWVLLALIVIPICLFFSIKSGSETVEKVLKDGPLHLERKRIEPGATKNLVERQPRIITTVITTTGKGENAKWGLKSSGSFVLTYNLVCRAEIVEKNETPLGDIKVVEKRTYETAEQILQVSDVDVGFAISECFPAELIGFVCGSVEAVCPGGGATVATGLNLVDGKTARGLLGAFGLNVDQTLEKKINDFVSHKVNDIIKVSDLQGKTYVVTYIQDHTDGTPSMVDFAHEDGDKNLTEEEQLVLRRVNAFMDSQFMPDRSKNPGDQWKIDSGDFSCLLDPYVDGSYDGEVVVTRKDDAANGDWNLKLSPSTIAIRTDKGRTAGSVELKDGVALLDEKDLSVKALQIVGKGAMRNLTKHHLLFSARLEGSCKFVAQMKTECCK